VEELGVGGDVPVGIISNSRVARALVVSNLVGIAVFLSLGDGAFRPGAGGQVVGGLHWAVLKKVVADGSELH